MTEHIFSLLVFGETLPKPTDVKDENVKYSAVTYRSINFGPAVELITKPFSSSISIKGWKNYFIFFFYFFKEKYDIS